MVLGKAMVTSKPDSSRRVRTSFTGDQLTELEKSFERNPYLRLNERQYLSSKLDIHPNRIKIWFQNRRMRQKREAVTSCTKSYKYGSKKYGKNRKASLEKEPTSQPYLSNVSSEQVWHSSNGYSTYNNNYYTSRVPSEGESYTPNMKSERLWCSNTNYPAYISNYSMFRSPPESESTSQSQPYTPNRSLELLLQNNANYSTYANRYSVSRAPPESANAPPECESTFHPYMPPPERLWYGNSGYPSYINKYSPSIPPTHTLNNLNDLPVSNNFRASTSNRYIPRYENTIDYGQTGYPPQNCQSVALDYSLPKMHLRSTGNMSSDHSMPIPKMNLLKTENTNECMTYSPRYQREIYSQANNDYLYNMPTSQMTPHMKESTNAYMSSAPINSASHHGHIYSQTSNNYPHSMSQNTTVANEHYSRNVHNCDSSSTSSNCQEEAIERIDVVGHPTHPPMIQSTPYMNGQETYPVYDHNTESYPRDNYEISSQVDIKKIELSLHPSTQSNEITQSIQPSCRYSCSEQTGEMKLDELLGTQNGVKNNDETFHSGFQCQYMPDFTKYFS